MKFSPIVIFLLILSALAILIVLVQSFGKPNITTQEGFLQYQGNKTALDTFTRKDSPIKIPYYSTDKPVHKLYDNIYYDPSNGAVIVLYGQEKSGDEETTGSSITGINIFERNGSNQGKKTVSQVPTTPNYTPLASTNTIISSYKTFTIVTNTNANQYELVYIPWGKETFLHLMDLNERTHVATFAYNSDGTIMTTSVISGNTVATNVEEIIYNTPITAKSKSDPRSHKDDSAAMVITSKYSSTNYLYQLCENVKYDPNSGQVVSVITVGSSVAKSHEYADFAAPKKLAVYSRPKISNSKIETIYTEYTLVSDTPSQIQPIPTPVAIDKTDGGVVEGFVGTVFDSLQTDFTVLYISTGKRSILVALYPKSSDSKSEYVVHNVLRFGANGTKDDGSTYSGVGSSLDSNASGGTGNDYLQMLLYLQGTGSGNFYSGGTLNDYMLKTQVVPPVCPSCPSCPSYDGVCASCGGKGGSGTQGSGGEGNEPGLGRIIYDTGSGTKDLLEKAGTGGTDLVRDAGEAGLGVAAVGAGLGVAGVQGAVGLGREAVTGTVGLGREVVGGTIDLAKDAGKSFYDTFGRINPTQVSSTQFDNVGSGTSGTGTGTGGQSGTGSGAGTRTLTAGSDSLSYFGALPAKGGNYIPVTADFSRFGR